MKISGFFMFKTDLKGFKSVADLTGFRNLSGLVFKVLLILKSGSQ
jgi:hypothetical protein